MIVVPQEIELSLSAYDLAKHLSDEPRDLADVLAHLTTWPMTDEFLRDVRDELRDELQLVQDMLRQMLTAFEKDA